MNVSTVQFRVGNVPRLGEEMPAETGLPASWLKLHITETGIMHDMNGWADTLQALHGRGVSKLRRVPVNRIKIDRSFVEDVTAREHAAVATATIVKLAHSLRVQVVVEGVETRAQADFGRQTGFAFVQGYFYGEPMTVEMIKDPMLRQRDAGQMLLALSG